MLEPPVLPVPNRSSFPGAATIHDHHGRVFKSGITVSADGMCKMMIHVTHARFYVSKLIGEAFCAALLVPHADEMHGGIQNIQIIQRHPSGRITFQVVAIRGSRMRPTETDFVQLAGLHFRKIETSLNRVTWETCVVFHAADTFFRDSKQTQVSRSEEHTSELQSPCN